MGLALMNENAWRRSVNHTCRRRVTLPCGRYGTMLASALALLLSQAHPFDDVARVLLHPRCVNCHPAGEAPLQTDASRPHHQNVTRRIEALGTRCTACHLPNAPQGPGLPPSAAEWKMPRADLPLVFQGRTPAQLCHQLKDPAQNGNLTPEAMLEHLTHDPRVVWSFAPGPGRALPPLTHARFLEVFSAWLQLGQPCPTEAPQAPQTKRPPNTPRQR
ncbi:MAG: hypothetical protein INH41_00220 [Myxococcaceae bacterium]|nr:hypothetical protein [Myxococcaceae bacterium]MCA3010801.1 hypothetical protein [Myxococcaceae bacterium]